MSSLSFDRAAPIYDSTHELPAEISERATQTILGLAPSGLPILEAGVGTGRIAVPLMRSGAPLVGVDLSLDMMQRLRAKHGAASLAQADASRLPFPDATIGAVLTVHVLHLVGPWREALREFRRVLWPGGVYLNSHNYRHADSPNRRLRDRWHALVEARGWTWRRPGIQDREELIEELRAMGAQVEEVTIAEWTGSVTPRQELSDIAARTHSDTWQIPDDALAETVAELTAWAATQYDDLDAPIAVKRRVGFDVIHF